MTKPWTREDTKDWIFQLKHRIEDIDYYLMRTIEWCEDHGIWEDEKVFICAVMTVVWVSHMRGEPVTRREILELLAIEDWDKIDDAEYELNPQYLNYELEELLENISSKF